MNSAARMLLIAKGNRGNEMRGNRSEMNANYNRYEMNGGYDNRYEMNDGQYRMENRFTDRHGRPHYNDGKFAPRSMQYSMAYGDAREPMRYEYDGGRNPLENENEKRHRPPFTDPLASPMNKIGFDVEQKYESPDRYRSDIDYPFAGEMGWKKGKMEHGKASGHSVKPMDKETATEWVKGMENEDGSRGAHWSFEQVKQLMMQKGINLDPAEMYAAMNMLYSDYCKVAKKLNITHPDYWIEMAKAFIEDKDAPGDKLARYYQYIVQA